MCDDFFFEKEGTNLRLASCVYEAQQDTVFCLPRA